MIDSVRALLARRLPSYAVRSVARLGEGWDNIAFEVNGELVVRIRKEDDPAARGEQTRRDADLLAVAARWSTLPVPDLLFADAEAGVLIYRKLPGRPLGEQAVADPTRLAAALGRFLGRLNRAPLEEVRAVVPRDVEPMAKWRSDAEGSYREIAEHLPSAARLRVEAFLARTPPAEPRRVAFCHNDLGAEHVLIDPETNGVSGIIDWGDAAIADPAYDPGLIYRDLGPDVFDLVLAHYDGPWAEADRERAIYFARCALLEDVAYGVRTGERRYAEVGLANLARTFGLGS